jgi:ankyrin repeat protein
METPEEIEQNNRALWDAAKNGDLDKVKEILGKHNITPNWVKDKKSPTALLLVLFTPNKEDSDLRAEVVSLLINKGYNVNVLDEHSLGPIHIACMFGYYKVVRVLIEHKADLNLITHWHDTPLIIAVKKNNINISKLLLNNNAKVELIDDVFMSALDYAVGNSNTEIIAELLFRGAKIDDDVLSNAKSQIKPILEKIYNQEKENIPLGDNSISNYISEIDVTSQDIAAIYVKWLIHKGADVNEKDKDGNTPLHNASTRDLSKIVQLLLEKGADVNEKDKDGKTPDAIENQSINNNNSIIPLPDDKNLNVSNGEIDLFIDSYKDKEDEIQPADNIKTNSSKGVSEKNSWLNNDILADLKNYGIIKGGKRTQKRNPRNKRTQKRGRRNNKKSHKKRR